MPIDPTGGGGGPCGSERRTGRPVMAIDREVEAQATVGAASTTVALARGDGRARSGEASAAVAIGGGRPVGFSDES